VGDDEAARRDVTDPAGAEVRGEGPVDADPDGLGPDADPDEAGPDAEPAEIGPDADPAEVGADAAPAQVGPDGETAEAGPDADPAEVGPDAEPAGSEVGVDVRPSVADLRRLIDENRANWDERVPLHVASDFYDHEGFLAGRDSFAWFEPEEVGDVAGLDLVHLQCHFGHDTLSWARRGARVTGVDFSAPAIAEARRSAEQLGLAARFVAADVLDAPVALDGETFDVVYTSHGALVWLPDVERWADAVVGLLRPGGFVYLSEFHPLTWVLDDDEPRLSGDYFQRTPARFDQPGSYAVEAGTTANVTNEWQHTLGDVVTALTGRGLVLEFLRERPVTLWRSHPWLEDRGDGTYAPRPGAPRIPLLFSLRARRPA
jgi:2-polyprenyl-3-methyl-5-hydroxy-6-metoxy-1,4-benzoquinol methylase